MQVDYKFLFDGAFLATAFQCFRQQHWFRFIWIPVTVAGGLVFAAITLALLFQKEWLLSMFTGAITAFILFACHVDRFLMLRRFRKSPFFGNRVHVHLSREGFLAVEENGETKRTWETFTRARQFRDGILLLQGPGCFNWLPHDSLVDGNSASDASELISEHIEDFRSVE